MARTQPISAQDEQRDEITLDRLPPVSAAAMDRRRSFAKAAREIAAQTPRPWDLDVVELLREDRAR